MGKALLSSLRDTIHFNPHRDVRSLLNLKVYALNRNNLQMSSFFIRNKVLVLLIRFIFRISNLSQI